MIFSICYGGKRRKEQTSVWQRDESDTWGMVYNTIQLVAVSKR